LPDQFISSCTRTMKPDDNIMARLKPGCICMGVKLHRILEAIDSGAASFEEIARLTGIGQGDCGGRRCGLKVEDLLRQRALTAARKDEDLPA
jgi:bacterioferritin-associated ferredoxin